MGIHLDDINKKDQDNIDTSRIVGNRIPYKARPIKLSLAEHHAQCTMILEKLTILQESLTDSEEKSQCEFLIKNKGHELKKISRQIEEENREKKIESLRETLIEQALKLP